jgi:DNA-binding transcriptional MerR regulator
MRIGEVAERAGVSVRALRYYEEQGLVLAGRGPGGHRQYPESAVERVKFIQLLYAAGLTSKATLEELIRLAAEYRDSPATCSASAG